MGGAGPGARLGGTRVPRPWGQCCPRQRRQASARVAQRLSAGLGTGRSGQGLGRRQPTRGSLSSSCSSRSPSPLLSLGAGLRPPGGSRSPAPPPRCLETPRRPCSPAGLTVDPLALGPVGPVARQDVLGHLSGVLGHGQPRRVRLVGPHEVDLVGRVPVCGEGGAGVLGPSFPGPRSRTHGPERRSLRRDHWGPRRRRPSPASRPRRPGPCPPRSPSPGPPPAGPVFPRRPSSQRHAETRSGHASAHSQLLKIRGQVWTSMG